MKTWYVYIADMMVNMVSYKDHLTAIQVYELLVNEGYPSCITLQ